MSQRSRKGLIYNLTGQTLEFYPPENEVRQLGSPSAAATYSAWRAESSNDASAVFDGTATLDSVSTVVSSTTAGYSATNRRLITLSSTTGVVPRRSYVIANVSGQREIVTPYEVGASVIYVENDLAYDYPTSSTFNGLEHSFTVDATFIATAGNINIYGNQPTSFQAHRAVRSDVAPPYRVRWVYATGGVTQQAWTYFDVVRQQLKHGVSANDLRELFPDITDHDFLQHRGQMCQQWIGAAYDLVLWYVRMSGYDEDRIREGPVLDELVRRAAIMTASSAGVVPGERDRETYVREAREQFYAMKGDAFGASLHMWIDAGSTGAIDPDPPRRMRWRR